MFYIKEFLNNPAGKGASILNISATKNDFIKRYDSIVKQIDHKVYFVKKDVYFLINIPSSVNGIKYDILVKFEPTSKSTGKTITDMSMQLFSNSPSFLYTYANAYDKQKLFIRACKRKLSSKMLNDIAKTKNPYGVLSYDFSIFAALYYIVSNDYLSFSTLEPIAESVSLGDVLSSIKHADKLQKDRKLQKDYNKLMAEEEKKNQQKKIKYSSIQEKSETHAINDVKDVKSTNTTKKIKSTKKVKHVKKR